MCKKFPIKLISYLIRIFSFIIMFKYSYYLQIWRKNHLELLK